ncbi:MAG TPA: hypothetical protein VGK78_05500 [Nocardioides sp.]|uniref:hypothetical protein n=1 Tax=Nocardioides sp. TaxID=35761 RepID=UPI002F3E555E
MSDLGGYQPPPPAPPGAPPEKKTDDIPLWVVLVAGVVTLGLAGLLGFVVLTRGGDDHHESAPASNHAAHHHYPKHWDHRIAPYARIAARQRGLTFKHPVPVRFLSPAAFTMSLEAEDQEPTQQDRREIEQATALLRAFGLLSGHVDLLRAVKGFNGAAVDAYYSFRTRSITVRGRTITPAVKATLVHELTHVLQDQYFHVGARLKALQKKSGNGTSSAAGEVLDALVEGDAERMEGAYRSSLPPAQQHALDAAQKAEGDRATSTLAKIPKIVVTMQTSPYTLGIGLARTAAEQGGNAEVNRLLRHPPVHETALMEPLRALSRRRGATHVDVPSLEAGEKKFDSGEFGALSWYLMLAARIPVMDALEAADGWGGDAYVGFDRGDETCARIAYAGRTAADSTRMTGALQQWIADFPGARARVAQAGSRVSFESCDPGTSAQLGNDDSADAVALVSTRALVEVSLLHGGATAAQATCLGDRLVQSYTVAQLTDPTFGANDPTVTAHVQELAARCR